MPFKIGTGGGSGSTLTPQHLAALNQWYYDSASDTISTSASVQSSLNSFKLAQMHTIHSGGENVFFQNSVSGVNWYPVWQGLKPLGAIGEHLGYNPTVRQYSATSTLLTNGATAHASIAVPYTDTITLMDNESVYRLKVVAGEAYTGKLTYSIRNATSTGTEKYKQTISVAVVAGDMIEFLFTHPSETAKGSVIHVDIHKEDDSTFSVRAGSNTAKPWLELALSTFEDVPVLSAARFVSSGFTMRYSGDYEASTAVSGFTIVIPASFKDPFSVSDAAQTFSPTNSCTVDFSAFGQGLAVLQTSRDSYKFYYDGTQWRYKDLDTKNGGVV